MQLRLGNHGWLTPAALGCSTCVAWEMRDLRRRVAYATRAATVSPPRIGEPNAARRKPRTIRRPCNGRTRVATVSPSWLRTASGTAIAHTPATTDWLDKSGGRKPPPWVQEAHLQRRRGTVRRIFARAPRAAGVSPPWFGEPHAVRRKPRTIRRPCNGRTRVATVSPPCVPYRQPQSLTHRRQPTAQTRAAGVSPPWVRETHLQLVAKVAGWLLASVSPPWFNQRRCERESFPRSAHADRSWHTTLRPAGG
jgi:hypothetical protein